MHLQKTISRIDACLNPTKERPPREPAIVLVGHLPRLIGVLACYPGGPILQGQSCAHTRMSFSCMQDQLNPQYTEASTPLPRYTLMHALHHHSFELVEIQGRRRYLLSARKPQPRTIHFKFEIRNSKLIIAKSACFHN